MRIDVHNHAVPNAVIDLLRDDRSYGAIVSVDRITSLGRTVTLRPNLSDPDQKLRDLERGGIEAAVVSLLPPLLIYHIDPAACERLCRTANDGLRDFSGSHPDRLAWMAHVPLGTPGLAATMLAEAVEAGAVGVEVGSSVGGRRLDAPEFEPFSSAAGRLKVPVFIHPAYNESHRGLEGFHLQNVIGNPLETTIAIERLICAGVLDRHPGVRLVLAHAGGFLPFQAGRLRHACAVRSELTSSPPDPWAYRGQFLVDTITHDREALVYLISRIGAQNVVLGTDMPADMATPHPMDALRAAADAATVRAIAEENPAKLYGFGG